MSTALGKYGVPTTSVGGWTHYGYMLDLLGAADSSDRVYISAPRITEKMATVDLRDKSLASVQTKTDIVNIASQLIKQLSTYQSIIDTLTLVDSANTQILGPIARTIQEIVSLSDQLLAQLASDRHRFELLLVISNLSRELQVPIEMLETAWLSDTQVKDFQALRSYAESLGLTDNVDAELSEVLVQKMVQDILGIASALVREIMFTRVVSESVGASDARQITISAVRTLVDLLQANDAISKTINYERSISDSLGIADIASGSILGLFKAIIDALSVIDSSNAQIQYVRAMLENVGVVDLPMQVVIAVNEFAESIGLLDSVNYNLLTTLRQLSDILGVTDIIDRVFDAAPNVVEPTIIVDALVQIANVHQELTESVQISSNVAIFETAIQTFTETVNIVDIAQYSLLLYLDRTITEIVGITSGTYQESTAYSDLIDALGLLDNVIVSQGKRFFDVGKLLITTEIPVVLLS